MRRDMNLIRETLLYFEAFSVAPLAVANVRKALRDIAIALAKTKLKKMGVEL